VKKALGVGLWVFIAEYQIPDNGFQMPDR